ncbi:MAG: GTP cyclohydrolase II [Gammaproteobacteria bacterium]|nr:GTP cyclohydrolase II [Gammaproteobacteria bacterium]
MSVDFVTVERAIEAIKAGQMVILVDDEQRENEGDLVIAAECVTPEAISFMVTYGKGLVCLPMSAEYIERLQLPLMVASNRSPFGTAFTVSIEAASGVTTGISAQDRAHTIRMAIDPTTLAGELVSPGHVFPLKAQPLGVLTRPGQTEGSVDLAKLAGFSAAAVICEILNEDGTMSRREDLQRFSKKHKIPMLSIQQLIDYRIQHELLVSPSASSSIPMSAHGEFDMTVFQSPLDASEHFALVKKQMQANQVPLVRIHCECITGDVFQSCRCDCGGQLTQALDEISHEGGILIYLRQEGRGIGLANKLKAYALQDKGFDTVDANLELGLPADNRNYATAYQILKYLGVDAVRLLTNNPLKVQSLEKYGIKVVERIPLMVEPTPENRRYLKTKQHKLGHYLSIE